MKDERNNPFSDGGKTGKQSVFLTIRKMVSVARIDIVQETGLSPATVTSITAELITKGMIEEVPADTSSTSAKRGRPRVNLQVRAKAHLLAGMKLTDKSATVVIIDYVGNRITELSNPTPVPVQTAMQIQSFLKKTLHLALDKANLSITDLSGVGIGLPGIVDAATGIVRWSPALTERDVPLQELLRKDIGIPVFLENDANLVALAEQRFGLGKTARNFIVITIEQGVGMGIVIDGKIYRGTRGNGAELGHTKVQLDGALCRCGQRGCLEAYVGDYALLREAQTTMAPMSATNTEQQMQNLFDEARSGNQLALSIFRRAGRMFAMGLANVVNIFDPELIILSGERMQYDYLYDENVIANIQKSIVQMRGSPPDIRIHKWGDNMWAMGAATHAMESVTEFMLNGYLQNDA